MQLPSMMHALHADKTERQQAAAERDCMGAHISAYVASITRTRAELIALAGQEQLSPANMQLWTAAWLLLAVLTLAYHLAHRFWGAKPEPKPGECRELLQAGTTRQLAGWTQGA